MNESLPPQRRVSRTNLRYGQPCSILRYHPPFNFSTGNEPGIGDYGFTSPRTGIGVNNELLQQRTGIGVTAPITPRTGIGVPPRTAGSTIAFPKAVSAYAGLYPRIWTTTTILRRILLTTRIDVAPTPTVFSSPFRTTPSAFRTTSASATFIVGRMPL